MRRLLRLAPLVLAAALVGGCGGGSGSAAQSATTASAPQSLLRSEPRSPTFAEVERSIEQLYRRHPRIRTFVVRNVTYTPKTRDKVLSVCHRGGPETDPAELESARLAGCAPLVFFFYRYGRDRSVPESVDVATKIYWYAVRRVRGPYSARKALDGLLQTWGVE